VAHSPYQDHRMLTVVFLIISNAFMTFAWYGHLKHTNRPLWSTILVSWGIAFFEYCFQVPANRWGFQHNIDPAQLKILTEAIALVIFFLFARFYLGEALKWNYIVSFALVFAAVVFAFAFK
jgi:uncharacterized protein (DUF486 family)